MRVFIIRFVSIDGTYAILDLLNRRKRLTSPTLIFSSCFSTKIYHQLGAGGGGSGGKGGGVGWVGLGSQVRETSD